MVVLLCCGPGEGRGGGDAPKLIHTLCAFRSHSARVALATALAVNLQMVVEMGRAFPDATPPPRPKKKWDRV